MNPSLMNLKPDNDEEPGIDELEREHHHLEKVLGKMEKHPIADHDKIRDLKKRKLQIKDQLTKLKANDGPTGA